MAAQENRRKARAPPRERFFGSALGVSRGPITMKPSSLLPFVLPLLGAALAAQTPPHLVGLTRLNNFRHVSHVPCAMLAQCPVPLPAIAIVPGFAGGTAWDPVRSGAWVSNGVFLTKVDDNCVVQCPVMPIPTLGPNAFITGMEVVEGMNQLWMIDNLGNLHFYTNACPPAPLGVCNTGLAPTVLGNVTTGLAVDEGNGIVFIAYPIWPVGPTRIVVAQIAAPCVPISQFNLPPCFAGFGAATGLAVDWGNQVLYATDGLNTLSMSYVWAAPNVLPGPAACCPSPVLADPLVGLAIRPGRETSMGGPCSNGTCLPCPLSSSLRNDPVLGNLQFRIGLDQAEPGSLAILAVGSGPCNAPGGAFPFLCGPLLAWPLLGTVGPNLVGGVGICNGSTDFNIPLPVAPWLAGLVFSSQVVTACWPFPGGFPSGFGMSNCISWQLQGN
jgi:hypothetical protein